jgi:hypothetical protein
MTKDSSNSTVEPCSSIHWRGWMHRRSERACTAQVLCNQYLLSILVNSSPSFSPRARYLSFFCGDAALTLTRVANECVPPVMVRHTESLQRSRCICRSERLNGNRRTCHVRVIYHGDAVRHHHFMKSPKEIRTSVMHLAASNTASSQRFNPRSTSFLSLRVHPSLIIMHGLENSPFRLEHKMTRHHWEIV